MGSALLRAVLDYADNWLDLKRIELESNQTGSTQQTVQVQLITYATATSTGGTTPTANGVWYQQSGGNTFVYADVDGNTGYLGAGAMPVRASGDGSRPAPGWTSDADWRGYVHESEWPSAVNPGRGYLVTANNKAEGSAPLTLERLAQAVAQALVNRRPGPG